MTSEQADRIFDPFVQVNPGTTQNYGGTGLGLTITKNIIELMGGKLSVESSPGIGSVFSFEIVFETIIDVSHNGFHHIKPLNVLEKPHFDGLILVCEDNLMNQQVICEHLAKVGLRTVVAENGRVGIEKIQERLQKGDKPFDLIFMDIFMPVMDGIEAAMIITKLNTGIPIVALTANIITSELEKYKQHGMHDCLNKPFTSQELWHVLLKHLDPVNVIVMDKDRLDAEEDTLLRLLRVNFVKNNQTTYDDIKCAAEEGDITLARRIAHTLKGNAGQIGEQRLREAAAAAEDMLSEGQNRLTDEQMNILQLELQLVLEKLAPMLSEAETPNQEITDEKKIQELFEKLELMLINYNPECMNMSDEIRSIPGAEELAQQIEDFDFEQALPTLKKLATPRVGAKTPLSGDLN